MTVGKKVITIYRYCKPVQGDSTSWKSPMYVELEAVLERIKTGGCKSQIAQIRAESDKEKRDNLKQSSLAAICFSGQVSDGERLDDALISHSNLVILDFDHLNGTLPQLKEKLIKTPYIVSCFKSPSGDGLKAIAQIKDGSRHREHYAALMKEFPNADTKNSNPTRVCFESYDPEIYINYNADTFNKIIKEEIVFNGRHEVTKDMEFNNLDKWLQKKGEYFETGNRNDYIFVFARAACRFGKDMDDTINYVAHTYLSKDSTFKQREANRAIRSAYRYGDFGSAVMEKGTLVEKTTRKEVVIDLGDTRVTDVIFAADVYDDTLEIYKKGYESAESTGIKEIDPLWKWKRGEVTLLSGIGNHGKSEFLNFLMLNKAIKDGSKFGIFSPENNPAQEFYLNLTEMLMGCNCTPFKFDGSPNPDQPSQEEFDKAYQFISEHFFYIYPKEAAPTPRYIGSRFLELIIKHKIDGVVIDPYNQLNSEGQSDRDDRDLSVFLAECSRFAVLNNVYYMIVAHPHKLHKEVKEKDYPCPTVFQLAGGAMWNNKCDNILMYHRPYRNSDPSSRTAEFHSKKIRRQKIVGVPDTIGFEYSRSKRRFVFENYPLLHTEFNQVSAIKPLPQQFKRKDDYISG